MQEGMVGLFGGLLNTSVVLSILAVMIVGRWKLFLKADMPGWASLVPFYSSYCLYKMAMGNGWYFLLQAVPIVNLVIGVLFSVRMSKAFGYEGGVAVLMFFFRDIVLLVMGFNESQYIGPVR
ncbi:MAG: DUF5684 domain-containing protein [Lachnospiraceae bacterium]|nr:DUF5684 domain-containing protein [Lachnospiraceae bacterium]